MVTIISKKKYRETNSSEVPVEPEVAAGFAEDGLVVVVHLLVADAARVDGRRVGILRVEDHRLVGRVDLSGRHGHRFWTGWRLAAGPESAAAGTHGSAHWPTHGSTHGSTHRPTHGSAHGSAHGTAHVHAVHRAHVHVAVHGHALRSHRRRSALAAHAARARPRHRALHHRVRHGRVVERVRRDDGVAIARCAQSNNRPKTRRYCKSDWKVDSYTNKSDGVTDPLSGRRLNRQRFLFQQQVGGFEVGGRDCYQPSFSMTRN